MLNAEMDHHLGTEAEEAAGNHRNGYSGKTVLTDTGKLELAIPRDRHGRFDPVLIGKYAEMKRKDDFLLAKAVCETTMVA
jgi:putative transposase